MANSSLVVSEVPACDQVTDILTHRKCAVDVNALDRLERIILRAEPGCPCFEFRSGCLAPPVANAAGTIELTALIVKAMGELMADAIGGTLEKFDLFADMRHFRIPGSQWMGNQIIALGMLYYRLRDML